jgi:hypothetical protein
MQTSEVFWVNACKLYDAALPFGGFKESGFRRDSVRPAWSLTPRSRPCGSMPRVGGDPAAQAQPQGGISGSHRDHS